MSDQRNHRDQVVDEVTEQVMQKSGVRAEHSEVRERAAASVDGLLEQPVQTFTPLLAENEVVTDLHGDDPRD